MPGIHAILLFQRFLVRPPEEIGTRKHYQRAPRPEFTTRCWQLYLAKAGPTSGRPLLWSVGLTQCGKRDGVFDIAVELSGRDESMRKLSPFGVFCREAVRN